MITLVPYHQDERLPEASFPLPGHELIPITRDLPDGGVWQRIAALFELVSAEVADQAAGGTRPTVVSGDCLTSEAVLAGLQRAGVDASVVWFDAHGDVHTLASSTSGYIGGMPLRQILGADPEVLAEPLGLRPLTEDRAVLVDARDLDPAEAEFLASSRVRRCPVDDVDLPDGPLLLHIDVDVIDSGDLPGLKFPVPGGPSRDAVLASVRRIMATGRVAALDIACPWHLPEGDDTAVRTRLLDDLLTA
ncbi:arginase family protein [Actinomadura bangladeshensis]|uniref:Arginase family protein n=1 Tax=Actinomadura bangladeshensis TaxID=453573 RepID=A0A6L9QP83_9ACTN|nr:arginase family protein [Actinomadura bangladeshensis]NEA27321.1 arginase family protein [Actinomadura bangladeshensis]